MRPCLLCPFLRSLTGSRWPAILPSSMKLRTTGFPLGACALLASTLLQAAPLPPAILDLYLSLPDPLALPPVFLMSPSMTPTGEQRRQGVVVNDAAHGYLKVNLGGDESASYQTEVARFRRPDGTAFLVLNQIEVAKGMAESRLVFAVRRGGAWNEVKEGMVPDLPSTDDQQEQLRAEKVSCASRGAHGGRLFEVQRDGRTILIRLSYPGCSVLVGRLASDPATGNLEFSEGLCLSGDCLNGKGSMKYPTRATRYVGQFKNGLYEGPGVWSTPMGDRCEGQWRNGAMEGQGTCTYSADGTTYVGEFRNGKREGQGTSRTIDGNLEHRGRWSNDQFVGE